MIRKNVQRLYIWTVCHSLCIMAKISYPNYLQNIKGKNVDRISHMKNKKCFVFDLDGTVYLGDIPIQPTVDFIRNHWDTIDFFFLSNNTSKSLETYIQKLNKLGILAEAKHILSPITPLISHLRKHKLTTIYPVGNSDFIACLKKNMPEVTISEKNCQAVVLAYDTELTYQKLATSALLLQDASITFVATHPDLVCPTPQGPIPDVGSFMALYETATGRRPSHIFGKPETAVLEPIMQNYNKKEMVMVGDRLSTDKKLAENAGIDFILVLSGEAKLQDLPSLERQPTLVVQDLGALSE